MQRDEADSTPQFEHAMRAVLPAHKLTYCKPVMQKNNALAPTACLVTQSCYRTVPFEQHSPVS